MNKRNMDGFPAKPRKPRQRDKHGREVPNNPTLDLPMRRFFETADEQHLKDALVERGDKFETFVRALSDIDRGNKSMMKIAHEEGVTLHELQTIYTDYMRHMGLLAMSSGMPQLGKDIAKNSLNRMVVCQRCDGTKTDLLLKRNEEGKVIERIERACPVCKGIGEVEAVGDKHAIDKMFAAHGLEQKTPLVNINQNIGAANDPSLDMRMESLLKIGQEVIMGRRDEH